MTRSAWIAILGYGGFAAALLLCLWLASLAPLRLAWGRELVGAAIAIVALVLGLRLAQRPAIAVTSPPVVADAVTHSAPMPAPSSSPPGGAPELSMREREVLRLLADGLSNKELARALTVSENTIKTHLANLYAKLGVGRRTEALAAARRCQLLGPG